MDESRPVTPDGMHTPEWKCLLNNIEGKASDGQDGIDLQHGVNLINPLAPMIISSNFEASYQTVPTEVAQSEVKEKPPNKHDPSNFMDSVEVHNMVRKVAAPINEQSYLQQLNLISSSYRESSFVGYDEDNYGSNCTKKLVPKINNLQATELGSTHVNQSYINSYKSIQPQFNKEGPLYHSTFYQHNEQQFQTHGNYQNLNTSVENRYSGVPLRNTIKITQRCITGGNLTYQIQAFPYTLRSQDKHLNILNSGRTVQNNAQNIIHPAQEVMHNSMIYQAYYSEGSIAQPKTDLWVAEKVNENGQELNFLTNIIGSTTMCQHKSNPQHPQEAVAHLPNMANQYISNVTEMAFQTSGQKIQKCMQLPQGYTGETSNIVYDDALVEGAICKPQQDYKYQQQPDPTKIHPSVGAPVRKIDLPLYLCETPQRTQDFIEKMEILKIYFEDKTEFTAFTRKRFDKKGNSMQQRGPGANRKYPGNNITENVDDKEKEAQRHKEGRERFKNKVQEKKQKIEKSKVFFKALKNNINKNLAKLHDHSTYHANFCVLCIIKIHFTFILSLKQKDKPIELLWTNKDTDKNRNDPYKKDQIKARNSATYRKRDEIYFEKLELEEKYFDNLITYIEIGNTILEKSLIVYGLPVNIDTLHNTQGPPFDQKFQASTSTERNNFGSHDIDMKSEAVIHSAKNLVLRIISKSTCLLLFGASRLKFRKTVSFKDIIAYSFLEISSSRNRSDLYGLFRNIRDQMYDLEKRTNFRIYTL